jgi:hypothetical protein
VPPPQASSRNARNHSASATARCSRFSPRFTRDHDSDCVSHVAAGILLGPVGLQSPPDASMPSAVLVSQEKGHMITGANASVPVRTRILVIEDSADAADSLAKLLELGIRQPRAVPRHGSPAGASPARITGRSLRYLSRVDKGGVDKGVATRGRSRDRNPIQTSQRHRTRGEAGGSIKRSQPDSDLRHRTRGEAGSGVRGIRPSIRRSVRSRSDSRRPGRWAPGPRATGSGGGLDGPGGTERPTVRSAREPTERFPVRPDRARRRPGQPSPYRRPVRPPASATKDSLE